MNRSRRVKLVLMGALSMGSVTACGPRADGPTLSTELAYTNNHHIPRVGYYHAPFRRWFPKPYNHQDPSSRLFFAGGQWLPAPHQSITNLSKPTPEALNDAEKSLAAGQVRRGGFGRSSGFHSFGS